MDNGLLIPGIRFVCLFVALWAIGGLVRSRTGQRNMGPIEMVAMVLISLALTWAFRQFVSEDSNTTSIPSTSTGVAALISTAFFGTSGRE